MSAVAKPERRAREYELIYILRTTVDNKEASRVLDRVTEVVSTLGGSMVQVDNWGRRKLAYPIHKSSRGVFVYLRFAGFEDLVVEIERNLRLLDSVIRFQTVLLKDRVNLADYQVDPEELKFAELDEPTEDDEELPLAQRLGLVERPRMQPEEDRERPGEEFSAGSGEATAAAPADGTAPQAPGSADSGSADSGSADSGSADSGSADSGSKEVPAEAGGDEEAKP